MRVFVAGATGAIGSRLVPQLIAGGHEVIGTSRSEKKAGRLRSEGAEAIVLDLLDRDAVRQAVVAARPDAIVHQGTALAGLTDFRNFDRSFRETNRLRTEGTDALLAAASEASVGRFVAQSFAGWPYAKEGSAVKDEEAPLDPSPPESAAQTMAAIRQLESAVVGADAIEGVVLRYGGFYGPGTSLFEGGEHVEAIRKRKFPIVGSGAGMWSFIHIDDVAGATLAAIERGRRGLYNIVDDEPAATTEWLPYLAKVLGAKPPRHVPEWLGRLAAGEQLVSMMTEGRGASNAKAKRELGWKLIYPTWREGFVNGLSYKQEDRSAA
jgi:2-alkyl-3-oxoalkanoate reductase